MSSVTEETLRIERFGAQGDGVAAGADGPVFIPYTAPGDLVRAQVKGDRGRILDIVEPSPDRRTPPCRHFGTCGGCVAQHLADAPYTEWKRRQIVEALAARGLATEVETPVRSPELSRRRAVFAARRAKGGWRIGFRARGSRDLVPLSECVVLRPALTAFLNAASHLLSLLPKKTDAAALHVTETGTGLDVSLDKTGLDPFSREAHALIAAGSELGLARLSLDGDPLIQFRAPQLEIAVARVTLPPRAFLQATAAGEAALRQLARAGIGEVRRVADLFSGIGTFAFELARRAEVRAFEGDRAAVEALNAATVAPGMKPVRAERRDLFRRPLEKDELSRFDAVLFDPPRAGAKDQAERLAASDVPRIVAVSCNPATFARDARALADGGYRLSRVAPVDQFLYAAHIELVGVFERS